MQRRKEPFVIVVAPYVLRQTLLVHTPMAEALVNLCVEFAQFAFAPGDLWLQPARERTIREDIRLTMHAIEPSVCFQLTSASHVRGAKCITQLLVSVEDPEERRWLSSFNDLVFARVRMYAPNVEKHRLFWNNLIRIQVNRASRLVDDKVDVVPVDLLKKKRSCLKWKCFIQLTGCSYSVPTFPCKLQFRLTFVQVESLETQQRRKRCEMLEPFI